MVAHSVIQADVTTGPFVAIAEALTRGDFTLMPEGDYSHIEADQWRATAQCCLDNHSDYPHDTDNFDPLQELIDECREIEREDEAAWAADMRRGLVA